MSELEILLFILCICLIIFSLFMLYKYYKIGIQKAQLLIKNEILEQSLNENKTNADKQLKESENFFSQNKFLLNENLKELLKPFEDNVKEYAKRLNDNEVSLKTNIDNIFKFTNQLNKDANNLTRILKGDKKVRGNFAEMQLQSLLENSGLILNEHYTLQVPVKYDKKTYIADVVLSLTNERKIIIDSKFSLPDELNFENIDDEACLSLAKNLKARIDDLGTKPYVQLDYQTYDFILLFIPYNNLLDLALNVDKNLYKYALDKKIYLVTPYTLFMALKTIQISWNNTKSRENLINAFEAFSKFHDKFASVIDDFNKLKRVQDIFINNIANIDNKLISGQGSLSSHVKKLEELGVKTQKILQEQR
ncbi:MULTISPECIES: DNA recombination protein RmuC [unclassified Campylobacter]|uniref:DNA recombination protein RmuC n=1 Tax=unclassified Campylobacter TaxID=2593542 RepID=UPI001237E943|nr:MULTISPECIES: DNA recombination protein RmuC [unclassified Campylobacter]KAA6225129.1 DNA recombination protein RmuC [Campylobacter sp. LR196d]KAA6226143.1 DNA recombination protein RmuC [Campylobacter sp. LR185c]KAA6228091.1 DNA recombination protein RmuC [Campylobacter sp. LR286c]KAA6231343.1 DNA recombination protein RmuC [Campylobacter sp. LR264d]KAA6231555.1 DNA recombination protein RmuC [Campylobacter sp. LR291e]